MNYRSGTPRYLQIADALRRDLRGEGERIASEHALCSRFNVSRPTIRQALDVLMQEGRLYRHAGRGTFATPTTGSDPKLRVIGSVADMISQSEETWFKAVSREIVRVSPDIAHPLRLAPGSVAYRVVGVRHGDDGPFQHLTAWVPGELGAALSEEDFSKSSVLATIERQLGRPIKFLEQVADAVLAPRQVAELLQVRARTPLLHFARTYFSASGEPVEHAITYQLGRRYPYRIILSRSDRRNSQ